MGEVSRLADMHVHVAHPWTRALSHHRKCASALERTHAWLTCMCMSPIHEHALYHIIKSVRKHVKGLTSGWNGDTRRPFMHNCLFTTKNECVSTWKDSRLADMHVHVAHPWKILFIFHIIKSVRQHLKGLTPGWNGDTRRPFMHTHTCLFTTKNECVSTWKDSRLADMETHVANSCTRASSQPKTSASARERTHAWLTCMCMSPIHEQALVHIIKVCVSTWEDSRLADMETHVTNSRTHASSHLKKRASARERTHAWLKWRHTSSTYAHLRTPTHTYAHLLDHKTRGACGMWKTVMCITVSQ